MKKYISLVLAVLIILSIFNLQMVNAISHKNFIGEWSCLFSSIEIDNLEDIRNQIESSLFLKFSKSQWKDYHLGLTQSYEKQFSNLKSKSFDLNVFDDHNELISELTSDSGENYYSQDFSVENNYVTFEFNSLKDFDIKKFATLYIYETKKNFSGYLLHEIYDGINQLNINLKFHLKLSKINSLGADMVDNKDNANTKSYNYGNANNDIENTTYNDKNPYSIENNSTFKLRDTKKNENRNLNTDGKNNHGENSYTNIDSIDNSNHINNIYKPLVESITYFFYDFFNNLMINASHYDDYFSNIYHNMPSFDLTTIISDYYKDLNLNLQIGDNIGDAKKKSILGNFLTKLNPLLFVSNLADLCLQIPKKIGFDFHYSIKDNLKGTTNLIYDVMVSQNATIIERNVNKHYGIYGKSVVRIISFFKSLK